MSFTCRGCLNPVTSTGRTSADIDNSANLEVVDKFCDLGDTMSVDGDAENSKNKIYVLLTIKHY